MGVTGDKKGVRHSHRFFYGSPRDYGQGLKVGFASTSCLDVNKYFLSRFLRMVI